LILLGEALLAGLILLPEIAPALLKEPLGWLLELLRLLLGLVYVLYVPGYLLQAALFARSGDLDATERTGLSLGLSVALVPLLALLLDRLPWGLHLWPVVFGQGCMNLLLAGAAAWRRSRLPDGEAYALDLRLHPRRWWAGMVGNQRRLFIFSFTTLAFAGLAAAWIFLVPSPDEFMTEFYMLGSGSRAEDYPRETQIGQTLQVTLGIANLERADHDYRLEIWAVDPWSAEQRQMVAQTEPFLIERGARREMPLTWRMPWPGDDQQVEFLLFIDEEHQPYRCLRLWLDVTGISL
jgi:uncharacterized membrane protein